MLFLYSLLVIKPSILVNPCNFYCLGFPQCSKKWLIYHTLFMKMTRNQSCPTSQSLFQAFCLDNNGHDHPECAGHPDLGGGREQLLLSRNSADSSGRSLQPRTQDAAQEATSRLPRWACGGTSCSGGGYRVSTLLLCVQALECHCLEGEVWIQVFTLGQNFHCHYSNGSQLSQ